MAKNIKTKKVGIFGTGAVAQSLASGFLKNGYEVMIGTRDPSKAHKSDDKDTSWMSKIGTYDETAKFGEILVIAVKGMAAEALVKGLDEKDISGKTVIDVTNPISEDKAPEDGVLSFFTSLDRSLMERLQDIAPKANFVKAWNSVGSAHMVDPSFGAKPTMFICGNSKEAKSLVSSILEQFGWEAADYGTAKSARAIEPLCMLWCIPGFKDNEWNHAFKLLKK